MPEGPQRKPVSVPRATAQYLESLRAAGVEWLGKPEAPVPRKAPPPASPLAPAALFPEASESPSTEAALELPKNLEERTRALAVLADEVSRCHRCAGLAATRTQTVFGTGPLDPVVCFVGEAPGADEDAQGEPFVGAAGQMLNRIIRRTGLTREEVYICNIIKCRPPGNRTPLPAEAANCREYLEKQLDLVRPKFLCALGGTAVANLLGAGQALGRLRGRVHNYRGIPVICTYHPSYLLPHRSPDPEVQKKRMWDVWNDMTLLLERMGRTAPPKGTT